MLQENVCMPVKANYVIDWMHAGCEGLPAETEAIMSHSL